MRNNKAAPESLIMPSEAEEKGILDKQLHFKDIKASFFSLYRYATWLDLALVVVGTISALIAGGLHPTAPVSHFH
jgi:ATP-binding cassette subfamily B (MDR/TAP) protein 1